MFFEDRFRKYKKILLLPILLLLITFNTAHKFADKLPDWKNLMEYSLKNFKFGETSTREFSQKCKVKKITQVDEEESFIKIKPLKSNTYKMVRAGFAHKKLDWLEFTFRIKPALADFVALYGEPEGINTVHSNYFDYYSYRFFNLCVDKNHEYVENINFFEIPTAQEKAVIIDNHVELWKNILNNDLKKLQPGKTSQKAISDNFHNLSLVKENTKAKLKIYNLKDYETLNRSYLKKIELGFKDNVLNWVAFYPINLDIRIFLKKYNKNYKYEQVSKKYDFYEYDDFILFVNKKKFNIISAGFYDLKTDKNLH